MGNLQIGDILSRAVSTWFDHFIGFFLLSLFLTLPLLPLELAPLATGGEGTGATLNAVGGWLRTVAGFLLIGIVAVNVFQSLQGEKGTIGESISSVKPQLPWIILAGFLYSIMLFFGFLACIVPGIILALMFFVTIPVIAIEKTGVIDGFKRSKDLTSGHWGQIFLLYLVYFVLLFVVLLITSLIIIGLFGVGIGEDPMELLAEGDVGTASVVFAALLDHGTDALIMPLQATLTAVVYHDLRQIHEGVSTEQMMFPEPEETDGAAEPSSYEIDPSDPGDVDSPRPDADDDHSDVQW